MPNRAPLSSLDPRRIASVTPVARRQLAAWAERAEGDVVEPSQPMPGQLSLLARKPKRKSQK